MNKKYAFSLAYFGLFYIFFLTYYPNCSVISNYDDFTNELTASARIDGNFKQVMVLTKNAGFQILFFV